MKRPRVESYGYIVGLPGECITSIFALSTDGLYSTFTFWRFLIRIPLAQTEMAVHYSINNGQQLDFWVPGRNQNLRWAAHSVCTYLLSVDSGGLICPHSV